VRPNVQYGPVFANLGVDTEYLSFKTHDGGVDDFGSESIRGHENQYGSILARPC
jgi:hypothetical protein